MTTSHHIQLAEGRRATLRNLLRIAGPPALGLLAFGLVTGAWLAFFMFVPFDWTLSPR